MKLTPQPLTACILAVAVTACTLSFSEFDPRIDAVATGTGGSTSSTGAVGGLGGAAQSVGGNAAGGNVAGSGGGGNSADCGHLGLLSTDFGTAIDPLTWDTSGTRIPGEDLTFDLDVPSAGAIVSTFAYRLDHAVAVELVDVADAERATIRLTSAGGGWIEFGKWAGNPLTWRRGVGNTDTGSGDFGSYDSVAHRWLRIRRTVSGVELEVSPDGVNYSGWSQSLAGPEYDLDHVKIRIAAAHFGPEPGATATFDNFDAGVSSLCKSEDEYWDLNAINLTTPSPFAVDDDCDLQVTSEGLSFGDGLPYDDCGLEFATGVAGTSVTIDVASNNLDPNTGEGLEVRLVQSDGSRATFGVRSGKWHCTSDVKATGISGTDNPLPYTAPLRYWRLTMENNFAVGYARGDSDPWQKVCEIAYAASQSPFGIELAATSAATGLGPSAARVRSINPPEAVIP